ncbi:MAG: ompW [Rickettsiaceae bacterium]|jgi:outer membrane protein|nr:ompW [Rickettsiaceae bacterium]
MKKYIQLALIAAIAGWAFPSFSEVPQDDYYSYEDEGRLIVKLRGFGALSSGKQKGLPSPTSNRGKTEPRSIDKLLTKGAGVEGATDLFFNDHVASELSIALGGFKTKSPYSIAYNYSDTANPSKKKDLFLVPISMLLQYHAAPFGAISPYVGGGLHYSMLFTRSRDYKLTNAKGPVMQAGVDFVTKDDTIINVDVKKYIMQSKIKYRSTITGNGVNGKLKIDPLVISVGIGYKF